MPAGLLIPSLISAGTSIAQGVIGSKASKKAAQQQQQGGERGLDVWNQVYGQQRQAYDPYLQIGRSALGNLGAMVGRPQTQSPLPQGPQQGQMGAFGVAQQAVQRSPQGQAQVVRLRAPDGSEQDVPMAQAEHYMSRGAQRVG